MKILSKCYIGIIFALLYAPIVILILFSFNRGGSLSNFTSFSLYWYKELFRDEVAFSALKNSLSLAASAAVLSTLIGTFAAMGLHRMRNRKLKATLNTMTNIPMMNPDIVTGISMMLLFVALGAIPFLPITFGRLTMTIAHTTFCLPYVILSVLPRFQQMDRHLTEAALDLGCTPLKAFFKVELHAIRPGIVAGLMMAFTLSLDDFVISHFVSSPDFQTLPLYIYNQTAHEVKYSMYALCALVVLAILILLLAVNFASSIGNKNKPKQAVAKEVLHP